jgi:hypothetical protein
MKFARKDEEGVVEMKPYRLSFIRAALLVTAARQEAQLQVRVLQSIHPSVSFMAKHIPPLR